MFEHARGEDIQYTLSNFLMTVKYAPSSTDLTPFYKKLRKLRSKYINVIRLSQLLIWIDGESVSMQFVVDLLAINTLMCNLNYLICVFPSTWNDKWLIKWRELFYDHQIMPNISCTNKQSQLRLIPQSVYCQFSLQILFLQMTQPSKEIPFSHQKTFPQQQQTRSFK